jgi:hypothetical protein
MAGDLSLRERTDLTARWPVSCGHWEVAAVLNPVHPLVPLLGDEAIA